MWKRSPLSLVGNVTARLMKVPHYVTVLLLVTLSIHQSRVARSAPALEIFPAVELRFVSEAGVPYRVQVSVSLSRDWKDFGEPLVGTGEVIALFVPAREHVQQYFRLVVDSDNSSFVRIPAGTFTMGSPQEEPGHQEWESPQHQVTITQDFYLQTTEVTWAQWTEVKNWGSQNGYNSIHRAQKGASGSSNETDTDPVTNVIWYDALLWLNAWSEKEGRIPCYTVNGEVLRNVNLDELPSVICNWDTSGYRLPTEAEWEYACRAGTNSVFAPARLLK